MTTRPLSFLRAALDLRSIRGKLLLVVGMLLVLGAVNVAVSFWGSRQRDQAFSQLLRAIDRQRMIGEIANQLENQKKFVDLLASGILGPESSVTPSDQELQQFGRTADTIPSQLAALERISEPGLRDSVALLRGQAEELAHWWKTFYANQGVDASAAVVASVSAEPIAQSLLLEQLPAAVQREKEQLVQASQVFVDTDRTVTRLDTLSFLVSALFGGVLAFVILRDVFLSIEGLKSGAQKIGAGQLDHRIEPRNEDELAEVAVSFNQMADELGQRTREMERQRARSEELLLNILPRKIADELRVQGKVEAKYYSDVTIMFTDLVGFTRMFDDHSVDRMVRVLDQLVTAFDHVIRDYGLEKLKTIGDAYMSAGGLTREGASHPVDAVLAGFEMVEVVRKTAASEGLPLSVRVGVHTGPVAAGVVGIDKFAFDVWGETVNFAARLETGGEPGRINIAQSTYQRVKDFFGCSHRGNVLTKEGEREMYFVDGVHPELAGVGHPPPEFARRYRIYFEREPWSFPVSLGSEESPESRIRPPAAAG
ncbi:MAG TPA: adenylate/guanylate cyclase domain-containing protein [Gemmatimonadota bacterium]|nr:adenylate/guanylate cyclase domain-containing protein [Gemmatimonadota bacterium]